MRLSAAAAAGSWLVLAVIMVIGAPAGLWVPALAATAGFTGLWLAHLVAFSGRSVRLWRRLVVAEAPADHAPSRRAFFAVTGSALVAVLAPSLVGGRRSAGAQSGDCVTNCIERQYEILSSCLRDCQGSLRSCAEQSEDPRGCVASYQSCTVRCTQRVPMGPVREHCQSACDRATTTTSSSSTTSSSTTSSSTTSSTSTTIDCPPYGCGG